MPTAAFTMALLLGEQLAQTSNVLRLSSFAPHGACSLPDEKCTPLLRRHLRLSPWPPQHAGRLQHCCPSIFLDHCRPLPQAEPSAPFICWTSAALFVKHMHQTACCPLLCRLFWLSPQLPQTARCLRPASRRVAALPGHARCRHVHPAARFPSGQCQLSSCAGEPRLGGRLRPRVWPYPHTACPGRCPSPQP